MTAQYAYNGLGHRVKKTVGGTATLYVYNGPNLLGEYSASGSAVQEYVYLPDPSGVELPVGILKGTALYYVNPDQLSAPRTILNQAGQRVWQWERDAFGNGSPNEKPGAAAAFVCHLRLPGQYYDKETGLFFNNARYYDPTTGRYTQSDPIGLGGGINTYGYVGGNPVQKTDPLGLFEFGGPGARYLGHADFYAGNRFNWNLEDTDPYTDPTDPINGAPEHHFRDLSRSEREVEKAISSCKRLDFVRAMHRGQDYFSHFEKGYRVDPFAVWKNAGLGHWPDNKINDVMLFLADSKIGDLFGKARDLLGVNVSVVDINPDHDMSAWVRANAWTVSWVKKWDQKCECK